MNRGLVAIEAAAALFLAAATRAETLHLAASLSSAADAPPPRSSASGNLWADLDTHNRLFTYRLTYRNLSGPATGARLRGPAQAGQGAAVALSDAPSPVTGKVTLTAAQASDVKGGAGTSRSPRRPIRRARLAAR